MATTDQGMPTSKCGQEYKYKAVVWIAETSFMLWVCSLPPDCVDMPVLGTHLGSPPNVLLSSTIHVLYLYVYSHIITKCQN